MYFDFIYPDDPRLPEFMYECDRLGYKNNTTIKDIKFDYFEHSAFFAGIDNDKIIYFSGVHNFDYDNTRYWRIGSRAVSRYDIGTAKLMKPKLGRNMRLISPHCGIIFTLQMRWVEKQFGHSKFILTSNDPGTTDEVSGKSHIVDRFMRSNNTLGTLLYEKIQYLNTVQNV